MPKNFLDWDYTSQLAGLLITLMCSTKQVEIWSYKGPYDNSTPGTKLYLKRIFEMILRLVLKIVHLLYFISNPVKNRLVYEF